MPLWPIPQGATYGVFSHRASAGTINVSVPTHASTPHAVGAWTQLIASTADDVDLVCIRTGSHYSTGVESSALLNLGIGANPNEVAVISSVDLGTCGNKNYLPFPLHLPAGTRVSAQVQGTRTAVNIPVAIDCYGGFGVVGGVTPVGAWTTYGANTGASCGTIIDIPASANTWSSWTEIAASTSFDHDWWMMSTDLGAITVARAVNTLIQVAVAPTTGAADTVAASGTCLYEFVLQTTTSEITDQLMWHYPRFAPTPAGSKIYARAQSSNATNNDIYVIVYGGSC